MIGCTSRGFSFTRALLGLPTDELPLCGDAASTPLVQELLKVTGDDIKVQHYERLSPLVPLNVPLGSFSNIRTGDCILTFSRRKIYNLKKVIETEGKHLCSTLTGIYFGWVVEMVVILTGIVSSAIFMAIIIYARHKGLTRRSGITRRTKNSLEKNDNKKSRELTRIREELYADADA